MPYEFYEGYYTVQPLHVNMVLIYVKKNKPWKYNKQNITININRLIISHKW